MHTHNKNIKYEKRTIQSASSFIIILYSTLSIRIFGYGKRQGRVGPGKPRRIYMYIYIYIQTFI